MRAPKRRRQLPRKPAIGISEQHLERCAMAVSYVGSAEHKSMPSFAGPPKLRSDASRCPTDLKDSAEITGWLATAIRAGLVNEVQGTYKGYPLVRDEVSRGLVALESKLREAEERS